VPRDRRIGRVGEAELLDARADVFLRCSIGAHRREEAVQHQLFDLLARELVAQRAADQLRAAARDGEGPRRALRLREDALLGDAARLHQRREAVRVEPPSLAEAPLDTAGEREVHVVAAEQQVIADGGALVRPRAPGLAHRDQREVRRAAADVEHQHRVPRRQLLLAVGEPRVERRLRLLEQRRAEPFAQRRLEGQLARHFVERRRNAQDEILVRECAPGH
jgi:hypothetical protein